MHRLFLWNLRLVWVLAGVVTLLQPAFGDECRQPQNAQEALTGSSLRVLTLNLAHGRKDGHSQLLQSGEAIRRNVAEVGDLLRELNAEVVALQEVDAPSRWSGNFDQVLLLAEAAGYPCRQHGLHAQSPLFAYGTALLARPPFRAVLSQAFRPSPPTLNKGFVLGQIAWSPGNPRTEPMLIDIVSVHLDFSRRSVRAAQVAEMIQVLSQRRHPLIVMGDFNSDWLAEGSALRTLAEGLGLRAYQPEASDMGTYPRSDRRLDWILVSEPLEFKEYGTLREVVSDHYPVFADLRLRGPAANQSSPQFSPQAR